MTWNLRSVFVQNWVRFSFWTMANSRSYNGAFFRFLVHLFNFFLLLFYFSLLNLNFTQSTFKINTVEALSSKNFTVVFYLFWDETFTILHWWVNALALNLSSFLRRILFHDDFFDWNQVFLILHIFFLFLKITQIWFLAFSWCQLNIFEVVFTVFNYYLRFLTDLNSFA